MKFQILLFLSFSFFLSLNTQAQTVADIVVNSPDHNTLEAALGAADLVTTLSGDGPFTVFAPTDAAFEALPEGTVDALLMDPSGALTDILLNHVVSGTALSTDLSDGQTIVTLNNGKTVKVNITADGVFINDAQVTVVDLDADNGVVHVVDAVILPASTVADIVINSDDHNTLEAALGAADLVSALNGAGPFTVFAPTDAAFDALPEGTVDALLMDPSGALTDILLNHVVSGTALSTDLSDAQTIVTLNNGKTVTVSITADGVFINDAQVTVVDLPADNGVVHVVDAVILPASTVADIVINSDDHTTLEAALGAADLVSTLNGAGPFTVFAPTDAAFDALPEGTVDALLMDPSGPLTDILLYHVVGASALSTDLSDGQTIVTLSDGKSVTVSITTDGVFIEDAQVIIADLEADNGVVHVIDAVLIPTNTVADIVIDSPDHNTLEAALGAAGLVDVLSGDGPFTVFAPTDAAFDALPEGTVDALLMDPMGALTDILLNHVVGATALSTDLSDGQTIVTLNNGKTVTVSITPDGVFIDNAQVIVADLEADNGVVHVIDAILLPPNTVADIIINSDDHNTLEAAVGAAGLVPTLNGAGPFTVFAPTDAAFENLPEGTVDALLMDPSGALTDILLYHVVGANALSTDLSNDQVITTLNGETVKVSISADGVFINEAQVIIADLEADNGVVHVLDAVLLPGTSSVKEADFNEIDIAVSPNPASDVLNIQMSENENYKIELLTVDGQLIFQSKINSTVGEIQLNSYNPGMYLLRVSSDEGSTVKRVIKQ